MRNKHFYTLSLFLVLPIISLSLATILPSSAVARSTAPHADQFVGVNVSFNTQVPLPDRGDETLADSQKTSRQFIYRLMTRECAILKGTIAETCRLTNLNVSTQMQDYRHQNPATLYLNVSGNAHFTITLKNGQRD